MKQRLIVMMLSGLVLGVTDLHAADGKALFTRFCSGCHYRGGNLLVPSKPLTRIYREANGIRTTKDLVAKMRRGGQGMPRFTVKELPDRDARSIAEHIIQTY